MKTDGIYGFDIGGNKQYQSITRTISISHTG